MRTFDLAAVKGVLDQMSLVFGHPFVKMAAPVLFGLLPNFGTLTDEDRKELEAHIRDYDAIIAEAERRSRLDT